MGPYVCVCVGHPETLAPLGTARGLLFMQRVRQRNLKQPLREGSENSHHNRQVETELEIVIKIKIIKRRAQRTIPEKQNKKTNPERGKEKTSKDRPINKIQRKAYNNSMKKGAEKKTQ